MNSGNEPDNRYGNPRWQTDLMIKIHKLPYAYVLSGTASNCQTLNGILEFSILSFREILGVTYTDLLTTHEAFWELVADDASPDAHGRPRDGHPIIGITHLPVYLVSVDLDSAAYIGPCKNIVLHPSRMIRFTDLLKEDEALTYEILPALIERAVNSFSHERQVTFNLVTGQVNERDTVARLKKLNQDIAQFYMTEE